MTDRVEYQRLLKENQTIKGINQMLEDSYGLARTRCYLKTIEVQNDLIQELLKGLGIEELKKE